MQSPPARAEATSVITLSPVLARPGARPRFRCRSTSSGRPRCRASVAGRISPALATRRWSSKAIWMRSGWSSDSIFWVLLAWGRFPVSKAIIPDGPEHFLTPSARRDTHLFGGLGLSNRLAGYRSIQTAHRSWLSPPGSPPADGPTISPSRSSSQAFPPLGNTSPAWWCPKSNCSIPNGIRSPTR